MTYPDGKIEKGDWEDGTFMTSKKRLNILLLILSLVLIIGGMVLYIVLLVLFRNAWETTHSNPHLNWETKIPSDLLQKNLFAVAGLIVVVIIGVIIESVRLKKSDRLNASNIFYTIFIFLIPTGILVAIGLWSIMLGFGVGLLSIGVITINLAFEDRSIGAHVVGWPLGILGVILTIVAIVNIFG